MDFFSLKMVSRLDQSVRLSESLLEARIILRLFLNSEYGLGEHSTTH